MIAGMGTITDVLNQIDNTMINQPVNAIWNSPTGSNILNQIVPAQPSLSTVSPTLVKGEHVTPPTDSQLNEYYNDPNGLINAINNTSWNNFITGVQGDIHANAPDNNSSNLTSFFSNLGLGAGIASILVVGVITIVGLEVIKK